VDFWISFAALHPWDIRALLSLLGLVSIHPVVAGILSSGLVSPVHSFFSLLWIHPQFDGLTSVTTILFFFTIIGPVDCWNHVRVYYLAGSTALELAKSSRTI
jgi:hypothetical protein